MSLRNLPRSIDEQHVDIAEKQRTARESQGQGPLSWGIASQLAAGVVGFATSTTAVAATTFVSPYAAVVTIADMFLRTNRYYRVTARLRAATPGTGDTATFYVTAQDAGLTDVTAAVSEYTALTSAETDDFTIEWSDVYQSSSEQIVTWSLAIPSGWGISATVKGGPYVLLCVEDIGPVL